MRAATIYDAGGDDKLMFFSRALLIDKQGFLLHTYL